MNLPDFVFLPDEEADSFDPLEHNELNPDKLPAVIDMPSGARLTIAQIGEDEYIVLIHIKRESMLHQRLAAGSEVAADTTFAALAQYIMTGLMEYPQVEHVTSRIAVTLKVKEFRSRPG